MRTQELLRMNSIGMTVVVAIKNLPLEILHWTQSKKLRRSTSLRNSKRKERYFANIEFTN
jgi:hypothetical protein